MIRVSEILHGWLGWCPNAHTLKAPVSGIKTRTGPAQISDPEPPRPGTSPATVTVPSWMTAIALIILFATFFAGGNVWWPFFVGAVLVICLAYWYYHHLRKVP